MDALSSIRETRPLLPPSGRRPFSIPIFASRVLVFHFQIEQAERDAVGRGKGLKGIVNRRIADKDIQFVLEPAGVDGIIELKFDLGDCGAAVLVLQYPGCAGVIQAEIGGVKIQVGIVGDTTELAMLKDGVFYRRLVCCGGRQRLGRRENKFVGMFPPEAARYPGLEFDIFRRVPLVDQGVRNKGLVETEGQVAERGDFVFGIGVVEADETAVTGEKKENADRKR